METTEIIEYLARYQAWRRGEDNRTMYEAGIEPVELGRVIDAAIGALGDHIPDATKMVQGDVQCMGNLYFNDEDSYDNALVITFADRAGLKAALDSKQCRFTVFGGEV